MNQNKKSYELFTPYDGKELCRKQPSMQALGKQRNQVFSLPPPPPSHPSSSGNNMTAKVLKRSPLTKLQAIQKVAGWNTFPLRPSQKTGFLGKQSSAFIWGYNSIFPY